MDRKFDLNPISSCLGSGNLKSQLAELKQSMETQLAAMEKNNLAMNAKIMAHLEAIRKNFVQPKSKFPIDCEEDLVELEEQVKESPASYIEAFRTMVGGEGLEKNMEQFFTREFIMKMNYAGGPGKIGLECYPSVNNAIFEASRIEGRNFRDYIKNVREAFAKSKNRTYKANSKTKKMRSDISPQE